MELDCVIQLTSSYHQHEASCLKKKLSMKTH